MVTTQSKKLQVTDARADNANDAHQSVEMLLREALDRRASDVHIEPTGTGYDIRYRVDGLLQTATHVDQAIGRIYVNRLMVAAGLLTYRLDIPQEGRCPVDVAEQERALDLRIAVIPTTHGLRAVVRLPADLLQPRLLNQLELPSHVFDALDTFARADAGMLLLCGPAGSGKTTTIYALLQHIITQAPGVSAVALEDPVERDLEGVTQIQVSPFGELTYEKALRSMLRQDPQVLALGEIRDPQTASIAIGAALSGHRLVSTLHAATPEGAMVRLAEMGIEPYQIASALFGVCAMRLIRCTGPQGVYQGRVPVAEFAYLDQPLRQAVLARADLATLRTAVQQQAGFESLNDAAAKLVQNGLTDNEEVTRVLGLTCRL